MKDQKLYEKAIEYASHAEEKFLKAMKANNGIEPRELREKHHQIEVAPSACAAEAMAELIGHLFEVSEEQIHADLKLAILERKEYETRMFRSLMEGWVDRDGIHRLLHVGARG